jgi:PBSX family phage terminase large subunit
VVIAPFSEKSKLFLARDPSEDKFQSYLIGAARSSKTFTMMVKLLLLCRYEVGGKRFIIGHSKETVMRNILQDLFLLIGNRNYSYNLQSGALVLFGVPWWVVAAHDEASYKAIQGSTCGIAYVDEIVNVPESFFNMLLSRLSLAGSRLYATSNPDAPNHWLKKRLDDPNLQQDIFHQHYDLSDNFSMDEATKDRFRRSFTGVFYQRYVLGRWCIAEGAIYRDSFSESCLYDDSTAPPGLLQQRKNERYVGIDHGTINQTTFLDAIDTGRIVYIDREFVWDSKLERRQKTNGELADDLVQWMPPDAQVIIDPAAAGFKAELTLRSIWNTDGDNTVLPGIQLVAGLFSLGLLKIHRRCPNLIKQLHSYAWDETAAQRTGKEAPIKVDDHGPDCLRYLCMTKITEWRLAA